MPAPASIVIPTRARPDYLEVALGSIAPQADDARRRGAGDRRRRPLARDARAGGAPRRPLRAPSRPARAERRAQHRRRALERRARRVRRRRRPRAPGLARSAARRGAGAPGGGRLHRPDRAAPGGRRRWAVHACGREAPADHLARAGRARHGHALRVGRQHGDPPLPRWSASGPFEVALEHGGDEQEWQDRLRAEHAGRAGPVRGRRARSSTAAPAPTRGCARSRAPPTRGGAPAGASTAGAAQAPVARDASCSRSRGCLGHVLRRRCPAGLVMVAHSAGRLRESLRDSPMRAGPRRARRPIRQTARSGRADPRDDFLSGASGTVGGSMRSVAGLRDEAVNALGARQRPAPAPGPRRAPRAAPAKGARARRRAPRAPRAGAGDPQRAAALAPPGRAALRRARRARQVREPQPPARARTRPTVTTGCC